MHSWPASFESWLDEAGIREEVTAAAIKAVIARQLISEMKKKITKQRMAALTKTSRAQLDRLLDSDNESVTLGTLTRAAQAVGRDLRDGVGVAGLHGKALRNGALKDTVSRVFTDLQIR